VLRIPILQYLIVIFLFTFFGVAIGDTAVEKKAEEKFKIDFSGLVKPELFWDTRQIVSLGDGCDLIIPKDKQPDVNGNDIDSIGSFNMMAVQTYLTAKASGITIAGADASATVDTYFFGVSDPTLNILSNYNIYIDLKWRNTLLKLGEYFVPEYVVDCAPNTISFNGGGPFEPFDNVPQLRLVQSFGTLSFLLAGCTEIAESVSAAGDSFQTQRFSSVFLRNSKMPRLSLLIRKDIGKSAVVAGATVRVLKPRLVSTLDYKVDEHVASFSAFGLAKGQRDSLICISKIAFIQNFVAEALLGGYGVESLNPRNDERTYTNFSAFIFWLDTQVGTKVQPGIFIGIAKNLGTHDPLINVAQFKQFGFENFEDATFGFEQNVAFIFRISPRIKLNVKNFSFGIETEYTHASFGTITQNGKPVCPNPEGNLRFLFATYYSF
jgi:hypothetical protein